MILLYKAVVCWYVVGRLRIHLTMCLSLLKVMKTIYSVHCR